MKNWLIGLLLVVLAAAAYYYIAVYDPFAEETLPPPIPTVAIEQPKPQPEPVLLEPVEEVIGVEPELEIVDEATVLPPLAESDEWVLDSLSSLAGEASVMRFFVSDNVVSRFVATVDALTSRQVPGQIMAVQDLGGEFMATANEQPDTVIRNAEGDPIPQYILNPANYQRYEPQVEMFEALDTQELVTLYRDYAPLCQQAYVELGYPDGDFDARLIEVIDSLLSTPEISEPLRLIKPEAFYLFTNPDLEALPAGQKALLRMGPMNAQRVKAKLREIRTALAE
ncbi:MAG: DUF3014 domain-containing protein [Proteobacteria bacterium]|nr:DUF3014 domain-containing protein [Pseudomonadota bacterium]